MIRCPKLLPAVFALVALASRVYAAPNTVAQVNSIFPDSIGQMVSVQAVYASLDDSLMLDNLGLYLVNEPLPPASFVVLDGAMPGAPFEQFQVTVEGILGARAVPHPHLGISPVPVIHVTSFSTAMAPRPVERKAGGSHFIRPVPAVDCDECKFSIILSGGVDANNNHRRYWNDVAKKYAYKTGGGYCDTNVAVLYYDGNPKDPQQVPAARTQAATQANFDAEMAKIKAKIEQCKAEGKHAEFQLLVTNHGSADGSIHLLGQNKMSPAALKAKVKELVDAGVDDVYAEFAECYGGAQLEALKSLADSTNTTSFHLASAAAANEKSLARADCNVDEFEDDFITARMAGLNWSAAFAYADSADSAQYANNLPFYQGWGCTPETPQIFESFAKTFTASGQALEFEVASMCSTFAVHFPGADGDLRSASAAIYIEVQGPFGPIWQLHRIWHWSVGKKQYFRAWPPGATGRYKVVSSMSDYPSAVRVEVINSKAIPETPSSGWDFNAYSIGFHDGSGGEFDPNLGEGGGGTHFVPLAIGLGLDAIPMNIGAGYFASVVIDVPLVADPARPFLYQGGNLTAPYLEPGIVTIHAENILDSFGSEVPSLWGVLRVFQPSQPSGESYTPFVLTRGTNAENLSAGLPGTLGPGGGVLPASIPVPVLYAAPATFEIIVGGAGVLRLDALTLDQSGPVTGVELPARSASTPSLLPSVPNPFTSRTSVGFSVPAAMDVRLTVYDAAGRAVRVLANRRFEPGVHHLYWDGRDEGGRLLPSGIYFSALEARGERSHGRLMLLR